MFRVSRRVGAVVALAMALGAIAGAAANGTTHRTGTGSADGYYSPNGNSVTWPLGPSQF